jgi:hypothetical protein
MSSPTGRYVHNPRLDRTPETFVLNTKTTKGIAENKPNMMIW